MKAYFTSGGLGDALICFAKLIQVSDCGVPWYHISKHIEHAEPIREIMRLFTDKYTCETVNKGGQPTIQKYVAERRELDGLDYEYVNTKIIEMKYPFLDDKLIEPAGKFDFCVQMTSGRMCDSTTRHVNIRVLKDLLKDPEKNLVLIGPQEVKFEHERAVNMTGKTPGIMDALAYVEGCRKFIGHDGVCVYYAAFRRKQTILNFHLPTLNNHYWNDKWRSHVAPIFQGFTIQKV